MGVAVGTPAYLQHIDQSTQLWCGANDLVTGTGDVYVLRSRVAAWLWLLVPHEMVLWCHDGKVGQESRETKRPMQGSLSHLLPRGGVNGK